MSGSRVIAYDLETNGLDPRRNDILLYAFCGEDGQVFLAPWHAPIEPLLLLLEQRIVLAHNAGFEWQFTHRRGFWLNLVYDTQAAESLLTSGLSEKRSSLADVVKKYCGVVLDKEAQASFIDQDKRTFNPTDEQLEYAARDVSYLHEVMRQQLVALETQDLMRVARLEMAVTPVVARMELKGFKLNVVEHGKVLREAIKTERELRPQVANVLAPLYREHIRLHNADCGPVYDLIGGEIESLVPGGRVSKNTPPEMRERITNLRKIRAQYKPKQGPIHLNLTAPKQVWSAFAQAGVKLYKEETIRGEIVEKATLDKTVVEQNKHRHPSLEVYARWAKVQKVISTYGESLVACINPATGRIHSSYNQMVNSGRMSSSQPNGQNMPPQVRRCFEPEPGNILVIADFSNMEGRIAAGLSRDPVLLKIFRENLDWHSMTAAKAWPGKFASWKDVPKESPERAKAKNGNFSAIFGGTEYTLYTRGYVENLEVGARVMNAVHETTPTLNTWTQKSADHAINEGWIATASGRKRFFRRLPRKPKWGSPYYAVWSKQRGGIRRAAMNHPIQGTGADITKLAMVLLDAPMGGIGYGLVASVHDELVYEGPKERQAEAKALMEQHMVAAGAAFVPNVPIPAAVKISERWDK